MSNSETDFSSATVLTITPKFLGLIDLIKFIKQDQSDIYLIQELKCTNETFPMEELNKAKYKARRGFKELDNIFTLCRKKVLIFK